MGFSKGESIVGQFSSRIFANNQSYLIQYLNNIIHGILSAIKDYEQLIKVLTDFYHNFENDLSLVLDGYMDISEIVERSYEKRFESESDVSS